MAKGEGVVYKVRTLIKAGRELLRDAPGGLAHYVGLIHSHSLAGSGEIAFSQTDQGTIECAPIDEVSSSLRLLRAHS